MATDATALAAIDAAFAGCARPERFTDHPYCSECEDHHETLNARDRETLTHDDVGSQAWDPICMVTGEGFTYYAPSLARLALGPVHPTWGWYGEQLIFHLAGDGPFNRRWAVCTPDQRRAIHALLLHILESRADLADESYSSERLMQAIEVWSVAEDLR